MKNKINILLILTIIIMMTALTLNTSTAKTIDINDASSYNQTGLSISEQIQAIIDGASVGDTINFLGDLYKDLTIIINQNLNIITNVGTTIINSNPDSSINTIFFINGSSASGTTISGFNLSNNNTNGNGITVNNTTNVKITKNNITANNSGVYLDKNSNITLDNNEIKESEKGIYVKDSTDVTIEENTISENNEGIYLENTNDTTIKSNNITKNEKNGITIKNTRKIDIEYNNINQNRKNGIYSYNAENTQIIYNNIQNNRESGILTERSAKNLNILRNNISGNLHGIRLESSDNSGLTIRSNSINGNNEGLNFGSEYVDDNSKDIFSNDISRNSARDIEHRDSNYYYNLQIGANWYGANTFAYANFCPMIGTELFQFNLVKTGNGLYTGTITHNGLIMSDLPPMSLLIRVNGQLMWFNIENGKVTIDFGEDFDEKNAGSIMDALLGNQRNRVDISFDRNNNDRNPIIGGSGGGSGGTGGAGGGSGNEYGSGPGNTQGSGASNSGIFGSTSNPADTGSSSSGSIDNTEGASGEQDTANTQTPQQQSGQAKEIIIDNYDLFRLDDVRNLTAIIIILLFGSIIMGYIIKKRNKKSSIN